MRQDMVRFRDDLRHVVGSPLFQFLCGTAIATLIFFARAPAAYMAPLLFAEDWEWTSMVFTRGFWDTAMHARDDYRILGNTMLVWLGIQAADLFMGDVFRTPQCLAVVSYAFFGAVASLPILLLRRQLPPWYRWSAWLLACFLPLGIHSQPPWSGFEILGRSVNVGYAFLYAAFILLWHRNTSVPTWRSAVPVDLGLLVCSATNPICIAMLPAAGWPYARRLVLERRPMGEVVRNGGFVCLVGLAVACVAVNGIPHSRPEYIGGESPVVGLDAAIEMGLARGLLYPLVWPWYRQLSTAMTLVVAAVAVAIGWRWTLPKHRLLMAAGVGTVAMVSTVLILRRGELAACLGGYRNTFPDRYFYGQNLVATLLMVAWVSGLSEQLRNRRWLAWMPALGIGCLVLASAVHEPPWRISGSQFLIAEDGAMVATARRALDEHCFVDAQGRRDPEGEYVQILVPCVRNSPIRLPRRAVERAIVSRDRRSLASAFPAHR